MGTRKFIRINKLFGKYDNEIDLSSRGIILIGENGVGKTTIMKIIMNLMNKNFTELIKYDFESIDIEVLGKTGKTLKTTLKYEDLLPSNDELKNVIIESYAFFCDLSDEWEAYVDSFSDDEKLDKFNEEWHIDGEYTDEEKIDMWGDFDTKIALQEVENGSFCVLSYEILKDLISKNEFKNIIRKIIKNEKFDDLYYNNYINEIKYSTKFGFEFHNSSYTSHTVWEFNDLKETLENIIKATKEYIEKLLKSKNNLKGTNNNKIVRLVNILIDDIDKPVDILDMTKVYNFENNLLTSSLIANRLLDWKSEKPGYCPSQELEEKVYDEILEDFGYESYVKDISELNSNTIIEINSIINNYFYNEDFVYDINIKALEYSMKYIKNNNEFVKNEVINEEDIIKIKDRFLKFIRPIMVRNSLFDANWDSYSQNSNYYRRNVNTNIFCKFYMNEWHLFEENINPKIKTLQFLLNKYMMNKDVEVTPMGLLVKSKDDNRNIPLDSLSSGEKKLLVIFMHCLFNEDVPIIIDEPEISLSIIWQENLLPDLLEKTNIKQVIVATHSSAVISDSSLDKYIIPLPNSVVDKGGNTNE